MESKLKSSIKFLVALFMLHLSCTFQIKGQDYHPLVKEGKVWNYESYYEQYTLVIKGDTLIDGVEYKKVMRRFQARYGDDQFHYFAAIREYDRRVYYVPQFEPTETCLYDFNIQFSDWFRHGKVTLFNQGFVRGKLFKAWWFVMVYEETNRTTTGPFWVEGVGSLIGLFDVMDITPFNLTSCYEDGELLFAKDDIMELLASSNAIKVVHNPSNSTSTLFDLQGRHLNTVPARGLYVKDGRKYVK